MMLCLFRKVSRCVFMCCSTILSSVQRLLIGLKESILVFGFLGLLIGVIHESLKMSGNVLVCIIVFIRCVICGAIECLMFLMMCIETSSCPVACDACALVIISSVCVNVIGGMVSVFCCLGMSVDKMFTGLSVSLLNVLRMLLILLM